MRIDLEAVMARVIDALRANSSFSDVQGELTGDKRSTRPQFRLRFTVANEERTFLYHVQQEAPVHTVARSLAEDTVRTVPQRIFEPMGGRLQPNDVYYPTALGFVPTTTPGETSRSMAGGG